MRTTISLDEHLLADAKLLAQQSHTTLTALIEDALRERVARRGASGHHEDSFTLHTFTGNGLQAGVDLDNSAGLRDLMDDLA